MFANCARAASQTEVAEGRYDDSPGQAERRPGLRTQNDLLFFFLLVPRRAKPEGKKEAGECWSFTPGGGLGGLARGYYHAASPRLRNGEPDPPSTLHYPHLRFALKPSS